MTRDATTAFARTLVDEWTRHGVTDACLAPGSRSAPLALAFGMDERIRVHVHLDERSASFFALGLARASGRPAIVLCTSGTAAANFHPAVHTSNGTRPWSASSTAGWKLAAAVPDVHSTIAGRPVARARPSAKNDADRSSRCTWTRIAVGAVGAGVGR